MCSMCRDCTGNELKCDEDKDVCVEAPPVAPSCGACCGDPDCPEGEWCNGEDGGKWCGPKQMPSCGECCGDEDCPADTWCKGEEGKKWCGHLLQGGSPVYHRMRT